MSRRQLLALVIGWLTIALAIGVLVLLAPDEIPPQAVGLIWLAAALLALSALAFAGAALAPRLVRMIRLRHPNREEPPHA